MGTPGCEGDDQGTHFLICLDVGPAGHCAPGPSDCRATMTDEVPELSPCLGCDLLHVTNTFNLKQLEVPSLRIWTVPRQHSACEPAYVSICRPVLYCCVLFSVGGPLHPPVPSRHQV